MRSLITDEFLWDIFMFVAKTEDILIGISKPHTIINTLLGFENPIFAKYKNQKSRIKFNNLIYYLKTKGYIKVRRLENKKAIMITKEGLSKVLKASFKSGFAKKREDGKWVMLIFDIPQKYRKSRDLLRGVLSNLGYKMFQQSVWVNPCDVSDKTEKLLQFYSLEKFVKIFLVEEL